MTIYCNGEQAMFSSAVTGNLLTSGLLAFVVAVITAWITSKLISSREHQRWILDNKKLEWRELVDEMHECFDRMANFHNRTEASIPRSEVDASIRHGFRILRNRIFVADTITQNKIMEKWEELVTYRQSADLPREPHAHGVIPTVVGFNLLAAELEDMLMKVARHDLRLATRRPWSLFSHFRAKRKKHK